MMSDDKILKLHEWCKEHSIIPDGWRLVDITELMQADDRCWWVRDIDIGLNLIDFVPLAEGKALTDMWLPDVIFREKVTLSEANLKERKHTLLVIRQCQPGESLLHKGPAKSTRSEGDRLMDFFFGT